MVKILFLCVVLVNIVFFIWEFRKGAPEVYLPPSYENSIGSESYAQKIVLLSELPEAMKRTSEADSNSEKHDQQTEVPSDTEVANETLLEPKQPIIAKTDTGKPSNSEKFTGNDFIETLNKVLELSEEENSQSNQSLTPLPVENAAESIVDNSPAEQKKSELTQIEKNLELNNLMEVNSRQVSNEQIDVGIHKTTQKFNFPLVACYQLKAGEYTQDMFTLENNEIGSKLELVEQQELNINSYLVLTLAASSSQEAMGKEQEIKQQGISDTWLFKQGLFKWRISLGLFSGKEQANKAKELFSRQTDKVLEVVPSYLTTNVTVVKISTQDEKEINAFEQKYSMIVERKIECSKEKFSGSNILGAKP